LSIIAGVSGEDQPRQSMLGHVRRSTSMGLRIAELSAGKGLFSHQAIVGRHP